MKKLSLILAVCLPLVCHAAGLLTFNQNPKPVTAGGGDVTSGLVSRYFIPTNPSSLNDNVGSANGTGFGSPTFGANHKSVANAAVVFSGANYMTAAPINLGGFQTYTVCGWFKETSGTAYGRSISAESAANVGFFLGAWGAGASDNDTYMVQSTTQLTLPYSSLNGGVSTTWNFICLTFDGSTFTCYLNGVFQSSASVSLSSVANATTFFGAAAYSAGDKWIGSMDTVSFYNRALSSAEQLQLYTFEQ